MKPIRRSTERANKSAFGTWFKAQYGALPNERKRQKLGMRIRNLESELYHARQAYQLEIYTADVFSAALKGWTANGR